MNDCPTCRNSPNMCLHGCSETTTPAQNGAALVLYSGPGGSSLGLQAAGFTTLGVELDPDPVATATTAGLRTVQADVTLTDPRQFVDQHLDGPVRLLQASPPCPGFSKAGSGAGRHDLPFLISALEDVAGADEEDREAVALGRRIFMGAECKDDRSALTFDPIRWIAALQPALVMFEQVPQALSVWEAYRHVLRLWGYSCWTGLVYAEQFGVPQTRIRAILYASRVSTVHPPHPSRSRYNNRTPWKLDPGLDRWVSMAEALGWGTSDAVGFPRKNDRPDGGEYRSRDLRGADQPAFTVTSKARSWHRYTHMGDVVRSRGTLRQITEPAPTLTASLDNGNWRWFHEDDPPAGLVDRDLVWRTVESGTVDGLPRVNNQSGTLFDLAWPADRPAPAIAGRGLAPMPGANANRFNGRTKSRNDGIRISVSEAGVLQTFPPDYDWHGTRTSRFKQVGNAVPPLLQHALTVQLLRGVDQ